MASNIDADVFFKKYVASNLPPGAKLYDEQFFTAQLQQLESSGLSHYIAVGVLTGIFCGLKRGDLTPKLFESLCPRNTQDKDTETKTYQAIQEAVYSMWMFVGAPQVIPTCLGMSGMLASRGITPEPVRVRPDLGPEEFELGAKTQKDIYKASGNSEVFQMLGKFFGDFAYILTSVGFGYVLQL